MFSSYRDSKIVLLFDKGYIMERILLLLLIGLGIFYLVSNNYIDISGLHINHIDSNTLILVAIGIVILFLLFNRGNGGGGRGGRRGGRRR